MIPPGSFVETTTKVKESCLATKTPIRYRLDASQDKDGTHLTKLVRQLNFFALRTMNKQTCTSEICLSLTGFAGLEQQSNDLDVDPEFFVIGNDPEQLSRARGGDS